MSSRRKPTRGASLINEDNWCTGATFGDNYNPSVLTETLTGRLVEAARGERGSAPAGERVPFNAKPFIAAFESAHAQLRTLRTDVERDTAELAASADVANNQYSARLSELGRNFDAVGTSFGALEERISDVSRVSVRVGEQLASLDKQRRRATEAHALIRYYYQFARGDSLQLDALRKDGGKEGRLRTAVIARRLQAISREIDVPGAEKTRDEIDAYCERFERDMLRIFDKYYRRSDPRMMAHIARVLQNFNGGHSAINLYVNQHDFFINTEHIRDMKRVAASPIWSKITDPSAEAPKNDPSLGLLLDEIRKTVDMEAQIIAAVFPSPGVVMQTFLQRVFAQCIQGHVELLLERAQEPAPTAVEGEVGRSSHADLAVLRVLQLARDKVLELVEALKQYDAKVEAVPETSGLDSSMGENGGNMSAATARSATLSMMLDTSAEELFVTYLEGTAYMDRESKNLVDLYTSALERFAEAHRALAKSRQAGGLLGRVRGATGMPAIGASAGKNVGSAFSKLQGFMSMRTASASPAPGDAPNSTTPDEASSTAGTVASEDTTVTTATDESLLSLEQAARMLQWHAEAIGRCVDLSPAAEVPKNVFTLVQVLAEHFNKQWLEVSLESTLLAVSTIATSSTSDLTADAAGDTFVAALEVLHQVELISSLWQHYIATAILPLVTASMSVRREVAVFNHHNRLRIEGKCEKLTQKLVDSVLISLHARLSQLQKKTDFNPKNDALVFDGDEGGNTEACKSCVKLLERLQEAFRLCLTAGNYDTVAAEVGVAFHAQLLEHMKKYPVSASGGLVLGKDLAQYQDAVGQFGVPALGERFEMLRQLGNLFIVQPASLAQYMQDEPHLATLDRRLLRPYLMKRTDYSAVKDLASAPVAARLSTAVAAPVGVGASEAYVEPGTAAATRTSSSSLADTIRRLEEHARVEPAAV